MYRSIILPHQGAYCNYESFLIKAHSDKEPTPQTQYTQYVAPGSFAHYRHTTRYKL